MMIGSKSKKLSKGDENALKSDIWSDVGIEFAAILDRIEELKASQEKIDKTIPNS